MAYQEGSSGRIADSVIESVGYPGGKSAGLEVNRSLVELYASELRNCYYGLDIYHSNLPLMVKNRIFDNDVDGIRVQDSSISTVWGKFQETVIVV